MGGAGGGGGGGLASPISKPDFSCPFRIGCCVACISWRLHFSLLSLLFLEFRSGLFSIDIRVGFVVVTL